MAQAAAAASTQIVTTASQSTFLRTSLSKSAASAITSKRIPPSSKPYRATQKEPLAASIIAPISLVRRSRTRSVPLQSVADHTANSFPLGSLKWKRRPPGNGNVSFTILPPSAFTRSSIEARSAP
jgi:hypothetical protein